MHPFILKKAWYAPQNTYWFNCPCSFNRTHIFSFKTKLSCYFSYHLFCISIIPANKHCGFTPTRSACRAGHRAARGGVPEGRGRGRRALRPAAEPRRIRRPVPGSAATRGSGLRALAGAARGRGHCLTGAGAPYAAGAHLRGRDREGADHARPLAAARRRRRPRGGHARPAVRDAALAQEARPHDAGPPHLAALAPGRPPAAGRVRRRRRRRQDDGDRAHRPGLRVREPRRHRDRAAHVRRRRDAGVDARAARHPRDRRHRRRRGQAAARPPQRRHRLHRHAADRPRRPPDRGLAVCRAARAGGRRGPLRAAGDAVGRRRRRAVRGARPPRRHRPRAHARRRHDPPGRADRARDHRPPADLVLLHA